MKTLLTVLLLVAIVSPSFAQDQRKIFGEKIGSSEKIVKGAPFSAEAVSESIQIFADGNRIVRRSVSRVYRDSEGRYRREDMPRQLGVPGAVIEMPESIVILDPVAGYRYQLNPSKNTGSRTVLKSNKSNRDSQFTFKSDAHMQMEERVKQSEERVKQYEERVKQSEERVKQSEERVKRAEARANDAVAQSAQLKKEISPLTNNVKELTQQVQETSKSVEVWKQEQLGNSAGSNEKTESLGTREIEGVQAEGMRITTTIPAGAIGNEREIVVINERWYSNDLQMIVLSKRVDPGFGEQTYRLTNINRSEPAVSLFSPPDGYQISDGKPPAKPLGPVGPVPAIVGKPPALGKPPAPAKPQ